jgi:hypothetical protein
MHVQWDECLLLFVGSEERSRAVSHSPFIAVLTQSVRPDQFFLRQPLSDEPLSGCHTLFLFLPAARIHTLWAKP